MIYNSLFRHTHIVRKLTFLGVQKCGCVTIGYPRKKVIRARSLKNGLILYEDFELRNEVTVTFPIEGIFQNFFNFKLPHTHSITPATWHNINPAGYRAVAPTQTRSFSSVPPYGCGPTFSCCGGSSNTKRCSSALAPEHSTVGAAQLFSTLSPCF